METRPHACCEFRIKNIFLHRFFFFRLDLWAKQGGRQAGIYHARFINEETEARLKARPLGDSGAKPAFRLTGPPAGLQGPQTGRDALTWPGALLSPSRNSDTFEPGAPHLLSALGPAHPAAAPAPCPMDSPSLPPPPWVCGISVGARHRSRLCLPWALAATAAWPHVLQQKIPVGTPSASRPQFSK